MATIYFAGPLFNDAECAFNAVVTAKLEALGFDVFLPQRDGVKPKLTKPPYSTMSSEELQQVIFELDRDRVEDCDVFLFVLDGRIPDEGACVELGIAYTHRRGNGAERLIVGLQTDMRAAFTWSKLNPMLCGPLDRICESVDELIEYLTSVP